MGRRCIAQSDPQELSLQHDAAAGGAGSPGLPVDRPRRGILAAVARYLGQAPCLQKFSIMRSPPNSSTDGSQLYHYDHRDSRQAKLFLNLCDVTDAAGPTHFLSAADSKRIDAKVGYRQDRYTDDQIYSAVPQSRVINTVGPAGTGFLIDTARLPALWQPRQQHRPAGAARELCQDPTMSTAAMDARSSIPFASSLLPRDMPTTRCAASP
jgi:hypothetical protein